jgi:DNA-binding NarL/FixJ family response regulator
MFPGEGRQLPIRVYLVDDHAVVRRGMHAYLEMLEDIDIVGEAPRGEEAVTGIATLASEGRPPHVVMMDLLMPGMGGIEATAAIKAGHPSVEVVAMTSFVAQDKVHAALQAGAIGYVLKDAEADEVAAAIRSAHGGEVYLAPAAARQLAKSLRDPKPEGNREALTDREREVLVLVAKGASNKAVGHALSISERTARTHVSNILVKLGLGSRTQAALWAIREGLVSPVEPES